MSYQVLWDFSVTLVEWPQLPSVLSEFSCFLIGSLCSGYQVQIKEKIIPSSMAQAVSDSVL